MMSAISGTLPYLSATRMNTVLVRYGHPLRTIPYTEKSERKIRSESRDIDENDIVQWLGETFGIFHRLSAEWRRLMAVYDVIGNMAIATSFDSRGDLNPLQGTGVKKMINSNVSSEFITQWFASVHRAASSI